jgi:tRNA modification GTPase
MLARLRPTPSWPSPPRPGAVRWASCGCRAGSGAADRRCAAVRLLPRVATYGPFATPMARPSTRAGLSTFPAPHSYTGEDVLELQAHGGPVVLQLLLARCLEAGPARGLAAAGRVHRARLPERQARPGPGRGRGRPDRRQHRGGGALGRPVAGRRLLARGRRPARALVHLRMLVEATLDFPEEEIDFLQQADARGQLDAIDAARWPACWARAPGRAAARRPARWCWPASPTWARARCSTRWPGPSWPSSRRSPAPRATGRQQTIQIEGVPLHVIDTAGLRDSDDEVERIGI